MLLLEWIKWICSQTYLSLAVWFGGFFLIVALYCGGERDASYAILPLVLAAASAIFFIYKHTTTYSERGPAPRVTSVLSMEQSSMDGHRVTLADVTLAGAAPGAVYRVTLHSPKSVAGHPELTAIIESAHPVAGSCRVPCGRITFKEIPPCS